MIARASGVDTPRNAIIRGPGRVASARIAGGPAGGRRAERGEQPVTGATWPGEQRFDVRWFPWRAVQSAYAHGRAGGIALHRFRHDLRRFGLGQAEPACHMLSADRAALVAFAARF